MADYYIALAETSEILNYLESDYISKIPLEILEIIRNHKAKSISFKYDATKNINEQNIHKETLEILSYLNYNFWLDNEKKQELDKIYNNNFIELENEKRQKYNPDDIFSNRKTKIVNNECLPIEVKEHENFLRKLLNKIKAIIKNI